MPTKYSRRPASSASGKRDQLLGNLVGGIGPGERAHRGRHDLQPGRVGEQRGDERRHAPRSFLVGQDDRPAALLEPLRVERLVIRRGVRVRNEERGQAGGSELPDSPARSRDRQIGRAKRVTEPVVCATRT